jgi:tetratricopeptide (TPR) repeat protein
MNKVMNSSGKSFSTAFATRLSLSKSGATVFFASACLMALELAAGRLTAQEFGSSLYTWTAVIGVVLAGLTFGSFAGGRIADRSTDNKTIAGLFGIASVTCIGAIILSNRLNSWKFLWQLSWPTYVLTSITILFFLPTLFLGAITPVVAKAALDRKLATGRTIGFIYASGAAGSIIGTFLAGFWLIPAIGCKGIIWAAAPALLLVGLTFCPRHRLLLLWSAILVPLVFFGTADNQLASQAGAFLTLRAQPDPNIIYEDETLYSYIRIKREPGGADTRSFYQDKLMHSKIIMNDITDLQYNYERIYAAAAELVIRDGNNPAFLAIGGGGFVFPRYLKHRWPDSTVDVAEIDPGVTKAALAAFGLSTDHGLNISTMDGRNFIDELIQKKLAGRDVPSYDVIFEDAFDNFSVPWQLVTREFNEKVAQLLKDDGLYMLNLIDTYDGGLALGSVLKTLNQTFDNVYILTDSFGYYDQSTFIMIASKRNLDIDKLVKEVTRFFPDVWRLNTAELERLKVKCSKYILTDDYAPVDNLTAPIAAQKAAVLTADYYLAEAQRLSKAGQWPRALKLYIKALKIYPPLTPKKHYDIGADMLAHQSFPEAAFAARTALQHYDKPELDSGAPPMHYIMASAMKSLGRPEEAKYHFSRAIEEYQKLLKKDPNSFDTLMNLGVTMSESGDLAGAAACFSRAIKLDPSDPICRYMLAETLFKQKNYTGAQTVAAEAINYMKKAGNEKATDLFRQLLAGIEYEISRSGPKIQSGAKTGLP